MSALLRTTLAALGGLLLLTACSGSGGASAPSSVPGATRATTAAPPASPAAQSKSGRATSAASSASPAAGMSLSGAWNGHYSGRYSGTFHLIWTQAGASLTGTIVLSEPSYPLHLTGHLAGARIAFGTVGSTEISYTGVVTGSQMIGSYAVGGRTAGTWRASHA